MGGSQPFPPCPGGKLGWDLAGGGRRELQPDPRATQRTEAPACSAPPPLLPANLTGSARSHPRAGIEFARPLAARTWRSSKTPRPTAGPQERTAGTPQPWAFLRDPHPAPAPSCRPQPPSPSLPRTLGATLACTLTTPSWPCLAWGSLRLGSGTRAAPSLLVVTTPGTRGPLEAADEARHGAREGAISTAGPRV